MKRLIIMLLAGAVCACTAQKSEPAIKPDKELERKVEATLKRMTLDEKVGQMCELAIDLFVRRDATGQVHVDEARVRDIIGTYKIGSVLNAPGHALTPEKWQEIIGCINDVSMEVMGIPTVYGLDQNHGTTYTAGGTIFPQPLSIAASFNCDLAYEAARVTAYQTRASNCPWTYNPTLDLGRDPRWPRIWENYGEDCYVNAQMGAATVRGFQGDDPNHIGPNNIAVSLKHYFGYGTPYSGKDRTPAYISPADLREKHFAPYLEAIKAGALTIMVNSGSVNGVPVHASYEYLTEWLKEGLNWDGMIVTDWADINNLYTREKVAKDKKEAIKLAINAGIDMSMEPYDVNFCTLLKELVEEGEVPMSRIDDAVRRILRLKYRLGLFDQPNTPLEDYPDFYSPDHAALATAAAEESMVLLKNEGNLLPLKSGKKILLAGPNANSMRCLNGGWTYTWQGSNSDHFTEQYNTIYEALCEQFGAKNVVLSEGVSYNNSGAYWEEQAPRIQSAVRAARGVDYIVVCVGENSYCETPGNLSDLHLSVNQRELVKALAATGKPIVLVLSEGRPRLIADIEPLADAVVDIILPGDYGGDALANLLSGEANFSGKLPFTYPKEINTLQTYDYKVSEATDTMEGAYNYDAVVSVQWAFGYGLSYTTYEYSNLRVNKSRFDKDDVLTFTVDVTNSGKVDGKEAVLLFSSDLVASSVPDNRRLRAFDKVELKAGESKSVELEVAAEDLAFVGADGKWILEQGDFRVQVGDQVVDLYCTDTYKWESPNRS